MTSVQRLPTPVAEQWEWQRRGACRGRDSAQFFHPDGERGASRARREASAKAVCAGCPVRAECAAHALSVREPYGVWGGFSESERVRLQETGCEDLIDRRGRADVSALERRLLSRPPAPRSADSAAPAGATASAGAAVTPAGRAASARPAARV